MEQKEKESENIELRSEKVRNVIGKVPPRLVSLGTVVITIIVLALAVAFYKIPYPIYKNEGCATILPCHIGKAPYIAQAHCRSCRSKDHAHLAAKAASAVFHFFFFYTVDMIDLPPYRMPSRSPN